MQNSNKALQILQILNNKFSLSSEYYYRSPGYSLLLDAEEYYNDFIEDNRFNDDLLSDAAMYDILIRNRILPYDFEVRLKNLENSIENYKFALFSHYHIPKSNKTNRKYLEIAKKDYLNLINKKYSIQFISLSGYSLIVKQQYLLANSIYKKEDNKLLFTEKFDEIPDSQFNKVMNLLNKVKISTDVIWDLAKSPEWKNLVQPGFKQETDEQRQIFHYAEMFDNIRQHSECPGDEIINDKDALEGWMIAQRRKALENKDTRETKVKAGNASSETFIPVSSIEDAIQVNSLNTPTNQIIKEQRNKVIKNSTGPVSDLQFQDVRQKVLK